MKRKMCGFSLSMALAACASTGESIAPHDGATDPISRLADMADDDPTDAAMNVSDATMDSDADMHSDASMGSDAALAPTCGTGTLIKTLACNGTATMPSPAMTMAVQGATRGDVITIDSGEGDTPCLPTLVCTTAGASTLLFSDDPESPSSDGILYAATVSAGAYRVYLYHTNGASSGSRKMTVVALNQGAADATITFGHVGSAGPSGDYQGTGAAAAQAWLSSTPGGTLTVPAGTRVVVDPTLDGRSAAPDQLVVGQLDFTTSATLKISVVTVDAGTDAATATATLPLLSNDGLHVRGTFPGADMTFVPNGWPRDGVRHIELGSGVGEPLLTGIDAVDGNEAVSLNGNYGLHYRFMVPEGSVGIGLSPRGGAWAGAANISSGDDVMMPTVTLMPTDSTTNTMIAAGRFTSGATIDLFSAGGSFLPTDFVLVPLP